MDTINVVNICKKVFSDLPDLVKINTSGIYNEEYEIVMGDSSFIVRMKYDKKNLSGIHRFLPIFQKLEIKTPSIFYEDFSKDYFDFCYQLLYKIEGIDLGIVIDRLSKNELKDIAKSISEIFDKFNSLPSEKYFGQLSGFKDEKYNSMYELINNQKQVIGERNSKTGVVDSDLLNILNEVIQENKKYFLAVKSKLYYYNICSKNVMIHKGKFNGFVDLDFLMRGDYLEAIGRIMASWYGDNQKSVYVEEIIHLQKLDQNQIHIVKVYAILTLIYWTSEQGIKCNSNTSGKIDTETVEKNKEKILNLYKEIKNERNY